MKRTPSDPSSTSGPSGAFSGDPPVRRVRIAPIDPSVPEGGSRGAILSRLESAYERSIHQRSGLLDTPYVHSPDMSQPPELFRFLMGRLQENRIGHQLVALERELLDVIANRIYAQKARRVAVFEDLLTNRLELIAGLKQRLPDVEFLSSQLSGNTETAHPLRRPHDLASVETGIFPCRAVIAQTGTLVVGARSRIELSIPLLPRTSIAIATFDSIYPDIDKWLKAELFDPTVSYIHISGPSRTADIEKKLVLGVHGPSALSLLVLRTS